MEDITFHECLSILWDFFKCYFATFFEASVFERSPSFIRNLHNDKMMLIPKFQNKYDYAS